MIGERAGMAAVRRTGKDLYWDGSFLQTGGPAGPQYNGWGGWGGTSPNYLGGYGTGMDGNPPNNPDGREADFVIVRPEVVGIPSPGYSHIGQFNLTSVSLTGAAGARCLTWLSPASTPQHMQSGDEAWYRMDTYVPAAWVPNPSSDWGVVWIWEGHNWPEQVAPAWDAQLSLGIYTDSSDGRAANAAGKLSLRVAGGASATNPIGVGTEAQQRTDFQQAYILGPGPVTRDAWIKMLFHVRWGWTGQNPLFEWYINGSLVGSTTIPNLLYYGDKLTGSGSGNPGVGRAYWQHGYYTGRADSTWWTTNGPQKLYHGAACAGPTRASVEAI